MVPMVVNECKHSHGRAMNANTGTKTETGLGTGAETRKERDGDSILWQGNLQLALSKTYFP